ncbi:18915_t:CDS:2 [Dentiscutata erythropus]|uniref:18915_t:CDS:1 n=1 Tax=Dentiscutata erythropus TaxID=1348616 RepID=A0A9N9AG49_9GLOM|nr:18915_t:CDS:2 [Dentiscutata erythropus]
MKFKFINTHINTQTIFGLSSFLLRHQLGGRISIGLSRYCSITTLSQHTNKFFRSPTISYLTNHPRIFKTSLTSFKNPFYGRSLKHFHLFKNYGSEDLMIHYIIASNILVFLSWRLAEMNAVEYRNPTYLNFLSRNFVVSIENVKDGRWWSVITCAFSHKDLDHLIVNMFVLWGFGKQILEMLGRRQFLFIYFGSALSASLSYLLHTAYTRKRKSSASHNEKVYRRHYIGSMGASGSLMALSTIFACTFPNATFLVFFVIPAPAIMVVGLYALYDIYRAWNVSYGKIDSAGHLGGAAFGLLYYFAKIKPRVRKYTKLWRGRL